MIMPVKVYHNAMFVAYQVNRELPVSPEMLTLVGIVDTNDLEQAFRQTNHIDCDWTDNDSVDVRSKKARSTSVGDVMVGGDGLIYVVNNVGFEQIEINLPEDT